MTAQRKPAPLGVPTAARMYLLGEVARGRVTWMVHESVALWRPSTRDDSTTLEITDKFFELVGSGWAYIDPFDDNAEPPVPSTPCLPTESGEDLLIRASQWVQKRKAK